jgi:hypothetical protein
MVIVTVVAGDGTDGRELTFSREQLARPNISAARKLSLVSGPKSDIPGTSPRGPFLEKRGEE